MRLAVLQSNYIPWKGYFDLMAMSDMFIVYDSVQYTKNDWRNRNLIPSASGAVWLTIPVATAGLADQCINQAAISDSRWARKHWATVSQTFAKRPHFGEYRDEWNECYQRSAELTLLHEVNVQFLGMLARQLAITTPIVDDREFETAPDTPTGKLVQLCEFAGADRYVTGPAGLDYLELERFHRRGIEVDVVEYGHYPTYPQNAAEFDHGVSVLDLLSSVGADARDHLLGRYHTVENVDS